MNVEYEELSKPYFLNKKYDINSTFRNSSYLLENQLPQGRIKDGCNAASMDSSHKFYNQISNYIVLKFDDDNYIGFNDNLDDYRIVIKIDTIKPNSPIILNDDNTEILHIIGMCAVREFLGLKGLLNISIYNQESLKGTIDISFAKMLSYYYGKSSINDFKGNIRGNFTIKIRRE